MPVPLQVRDVRDALFLAGGGHTTGSGEPSTLLLGRLFHEVCAEFVGPNDALNFRAVLCEAEPSLERWRSDLLEHAYRTLVGPRLKQHHALLHHVAAQVLTFWQAVQELCNWLAELLWLAREQGLLQLDAPAGSPAARAGLVSEQPLVWELREPGWTDSVRLTGLADLVWRLPGKGRCVIELKLGRTSPEADLGQACLYHHMLVASGEAAPAATPLALVSFEPARRERLFTPAELQQAQARLKALIGRLTGVIGGPQEKTSPEYKDLGQRLVKAFKEYGLTLSLEGEPVAGPTFIRFSVKLGTGVRYDAVVRRAADVGLQLHLGTPPHVGVERGRVCIDVQRPDRQEVRFAHVRDQLPRRDPRVGCAKIPIGVDLNGKLRLADLAEPYHAHLLVAGTTGSGKSEWLRSVIAGLIATNTPQTLRLVLIDPKRNAFPWLKDSPFLLRPLVFPQDESVIEVLEGLVEEMERRYRALEETHSSSLAEHNEKVSEPLPRIVCVCDEYADLMLADKQQRLAVETVVTRLGSKARAAGIHLILATQQPSRKIVSGPIDANMPARVGLLMAKSIESNMLLGDSGAKDLLGKGDLLFKDIGEPVRLQSPYLTEEDREQVLRETVAKPVSSAK